MYLYRIASVFAFCALLSSCKHAQPRPVLFGFNAVQCVQVRQVVCVADEDYSAEDCSKDVKDAITEVNEAVGREVFRYAGVISPNGLEHAHKTGMLPVAGIPQESLPMPNVLAFTIPHVALVHDVPCITQVLMGVGPDIAKRLNPKIRGSWVIAHELVHALGANHANPDGYFGSRMEPVFSATLGECFSTADKWTLRVVYGD